MANRNAFAALIGLAAVATAVAREVAQARRRAALAVRRTLTQSELRDLREGRARVEYGVARTWQLSPEEAARVAAAWPAFTPDVSTELQ